MKSDGRNNNIGKNTSTTNMASVVSEWEDSVLFDADDPDFNNATTATSIFQQQNVSNGLQMLNGFRLKSVASNLSISGSSQHLTELCNSMRPNSISMTSSLSDLMSSSLDISSDNNVITIEELRAQMGSCFTCGVSWTDDHVSLDCSECGGYSSSRPCPLCDGVCGITWKRDFTMSHASGKARWHGVCPTMSIDSMHNNFPANAAAPVVLSQVTPQTCSAASQFLAQELCARLEKLSAASAQT